MSKKDRVKECDSSINCNDRPKSVTESESLNMKVQERVRYNQETFHLRHEGKKTFEDEHTLSECDIENESTIQSLNTTRE